MQLRKNNTKWVFFLGVSNGHNPELRHILDLAYGIKCMESHGVQANDIEIYIDGIDRANIAKIIQTGTKNNYNIQYTQDFLNNTNSNTHENSVVFISGHGSHLGIDASITVTPSTLIRSLKNTPNLKKSIVFLGQCYAGTFNYMPARKSSQNDADVILIGATDLHSSLSSHTNEIFLNNQTLSWIANVFLLFVFKWLEKPVDIDGDGKYTIMDCYKYAGCMANNFNKANRSYSFEYSIEARDKYKQKKIEYENSRLATPPDIVKETIKALELRQAKDDYTRSCDIYHTHQECWILNSVPAQIIEY